MSKQQPLLREEIKDEILERHLQAITKLKNKFLERKFCRDPDKDTRNNSRTVSVTSKSSKSNVNPDTKLDNKLNRNVGGMGLENSLTDKNDMVAFLEDFITLHYFLSGIVCHYPEIKVSPENVQKIIVKHVCKQLDAIVEDGHALIELLGGDIYKYKATKAPNFFTFRMLTVIYTASNYDIREFIVHPAIQSVLNNHGLAEVHKNPKKILLSLVIYLCYPIFIMKATWESYFVRQPIVSQILPVYGIANIILTMIFYIVLQNESGQDGFEDRFFIGFLLKFLSKEQLSKITVAIIFGWWLSFIIKEFTEFKQTSTLWHKNKRYTDFDPEEFYQKKQETPETKSPPIKVNGLENRGQKVGNGQKGDVEKGVAEKEGPNGVIDGPIKNSVTSTVVNAAEPNNVRQRNATNESGKIDVTKPKSSSITTLHAPDSSFIDISGKIGLNRQNSSRFTVTKGEGLPAKNLNNNNNKENEKSRSDSQKHKSSNSLSKNLTIQPSPDQAQSENIYTKQTSTVNELPTFSNKIRNSLTQTFSRNYSSRSSRFSKHPLKISKTSDRSHPQPDIDSGSNLLKVQAAQTASAHSLYELTVDRLTVESAHILQKTLLFEDLKHAKIEFDELWKRKEEKREENNKPTTQPEIAPWDPKDFLKIAEIKQQAKHTSYFRNFWNRVDWIIMVSLLGFFLNYKFKNMPCEAKLDQETGEYGECLPIFTDGIFANEFLEKICFAVALLCLIFRVLEHLGNLITTLGPFIRAFVKIFFVLMIFMILITFIAMGCTFALSNFICQKPTLDQYKYLNNSHCGKNCFSDNNRKHGSEFYELFKNKKINLPLVTRELDEFKFCQTVIPEIENITDNKDLFRYEVCVARIFKHFMVQPFGCTKGKACEYPYFVEQRFDEKFLHCYGEHINIVIDYIHMFFYTTIVVAVMRGVLIKFLMGSKGEETDTLTVYRTRAYVTSIFAVGSGEDPFSGTHPIPWNLPLFFMEATMWILKECGKVYDERQQEKKKKEMSKRKTEAEQLKLDREQKWENGGAENEALLGQKIVNSRFTTFVEKNNIVNEDLVTVYVENDKFEKYDVATGHPSDVEAQFSRTNLTSKTDRSALNSVEITRKHLSSTNAETSTGESRAATITDPNFFRSQSEIQKSGTNVGNKPELENVFLPASP